MSNPKVRVEFGASNLGIQAADASGTFGVIAAIPAAPTSGYGTAVVIKSKKQAKTELANAANAGMLAAINQGFFSQVSEGTPLYLVFVANTATLEDMANIDNPYVTALNTLSGNKLRAIGVVRYPDNTYTPVFAKGFDVDVHKSVIKAQAQADYWIGKYKPIEFIIEGRGFQNATDANDYTTTINKNVHIVCGAENGNSGIMVLRALGKKASKPVQKNIGRVRSGSLKIAQDAVVTLGENRTVTSAETKATATLTISAVGTTGQSLYILIPSPTGAVFGGMYYWTATDDTPTKIATAIRNMITSYTGNYIAATSAAGVITIPAPAGYGATMNGYVLTVTGSIGFTKTNFSGGVNAGTTLVNAIKLDDVDPVDLDTLHDKGYITYIGNEDAPGYIFNDDVSCTDPTSDYATWSHNAVLGEAMRIAYAAYYKELKEDIEVDDNGQLYPAKQASLAQAIEEAIDNQIGGNISKVAALVNPDTTTFAGLYANADIDNINLNLLTGGKLYVFLTIRPKGYIKDVLVMLGFGL